MLNVYYMLLDESNGFELSYKHAGCVCNSIFVECFSFFFLNSLKLVYKVPKFFYISFFRFDSWTPLHTYGSDFFIAKDKYLMAIVMCALLVSIYEIVADQIK